MIFQRFTPTEDGYKYLLSLIKNGNISHFETAASPFRFQHLTSFTVKWESFQPPIEEKHMICISLRSLPDFVNSIKKGNQTLLSTVFSDLKIRWFNKLGFKTEISLYPTETAKRSQYKIDFLLKLNNHIGWNVLHLIQNTKNDLPLVLESLSSLNIISAIRKETQSVFTALSATFACESHMAMSLLTTSFLSKQHAFL